MARHEGGDYRFEARLAPTWIRLPRERPQLRVKEGKPRIRAAHIARQNHRSPRLRAPDFIRENLVRDRFLVVTRSMFLHSESVEVAPGPLARNKRRRSSN